MTCRECTEFLLEFLAGELQGDLCERIRQHLERCPPCITYVETYQITVRLTRQLPCRPLPADVAERLEAALRRCCDQGEQQG